MATMIGACKKHYHLSEQMNLLCKEIDLYNDMKQQNKKLSTSDWNSIIQGLCKCEWDKEGAFFFGQMTKEVEESPHAATIFLVLKTLVRLKCLEDIIQLVIPLMDRLDMTIQPQVYTDIIKLCAEEKHLEYGRVMHAHLIKGGFDRDAYINTTLISMYSKCGGLEDAFKIFKAMNKKNAVTWTAMISGYASHGKGKEAINMFQQMRSGGVQPDANAYNIMLTICANMGWLEVGQKIHNMIPDSLLQDVFVKNALINMYSKCGRLEDAFKIFNTMNKKNVVTWTAMISGYATHGKGKEAIDLFNQMKSDGIYAGANTYNIVLTICADMGWLDVGKKIHNMIPRSMLQDPFINTALINMYSKCGRLEDAFIVFNAIDKHGRDIVTWTTMISAYGTHGRGKEALALFGQMTASGVKPNSISFVSLLTACSHSGLVDEALELFGSMNNIYGVQSGDAHRNCLVDALARSGQLEKAEEFMDETEEPDVIALTTLLGACRSWKDVERAERVFSKIIALDPSHAAPYVLLVNIYASAGRVGDAQKIRLLMKEKSIKKIPGITNIIVDGQHSFVSQDISHPRTKEIYEKLQALHFKMVEAGYKVDTSWVTCSDGEYSEQEKKQFLRYHSERIAIGFALISTPEGAPIILMNNIRVCGDCHGAIKYMAMVTGREITVRDANRFHHFTPDGKCSCGDYW